MTNYTSKTIKIQDKKSILEKCTDKKLKNPKFSNYIEPLVSKKLTERIKKNVETFYRC